jgi:hypothetical protein
MSWHEGQREAVAYKLVEHGERADQTDREEEEREGPEDALLAERRHDGHARAVEAEARRALCLSLALARGADRRRAARKVAATGDGARLQRRRNLNVDRSESKVDGGLAPAHVRQEERRRTGGRKGDRHMHSAIVRDMHCAIRRAGAESGAADANVLSIAHVAIASANTPTQACMDLGGVEMARQAAEAVLHAQEHRDGRADDEGSCRRNLRQAARWVDTRTVAWRLLLPTEPLCRSRAGRHFD